MTEHDTETNESKVAMKSGLLWLGSARVAIRIIDVVALVVVLSYLSKEEIGQAATAISFCSILEAISGSGVGVGAALVQKQNISRGQVQSAFTFSILVGVLCGLLLAASSPVISWAYAAPSVGLMCVVLGVRQLTVGAVAIPIQVLNRNLQFREVAAAQTFASLAAALLRAGAAFAGAGPWALIVGELVQSFALMVGVLVFSKLRFEARLNRDELRPLLRFGSRIAAADGVHKFFLNVDYLIIGRILGMAALGTYRVAFDIAMQVVMPFAMVLTRTSVPVLSRLAGRPVPFRQMFLWATRTVGLIATPVLLVLFVTAEDLLILVADGEFLDAALTVRLLLGAAALRVHFQLFAPMLTAWGRSGLVLRLEVITLLILMVALVACLSLLPSEFGVASAGVAWLVTYPLSIAAALHMARRTIGLDRLEFLKETRSAILLLVVGVTAALILMEWSRDLPLWARLTTRPLGTLAVCYGVVRYGLGVRIRDAMTTKPSEPAESTNQTE